MGSTQFPPLPEGMETHMVYNHALPTRQFPFLVKWDHFLPFSLEFGLWYRGQCKNYLLEDREQKPDFAAYSLRHPCGIGLTWVPALVLRTGPVFFPVTV